MRKKLREIAESHEINFFYPDAESACIAINETTTLDDLNAIISVFAELAEKDAKETDELSENSRIPADLQRQTEFLTHEVFNIYHSETELMRYIKKTGA